MDNKNFFRENVNKTHTAYSRKNENSDNFFVTASSSVDTKKVFNKSKWRSQKYSLKNKIANWKEKREDYIMHGYRKEKNRQTEIKFDVQKIYEEEERRGREEGSTDTITTNERNSKKKGGHKKLSETFCDKKEDVKLRREQFLKKKAEKEETLRKRRKEKLEKYKKLNKKTKKGQPVMKGRIEYLLEKIQKNMSS